MNIRNSLNIKANTTVWTTAWAKSLTALAAAALVIAQATSVRANSFSYNSQRRLVRAGVVISNAALGVANLPENAVPYVFYVMDRRTDVKPAGWQFVNPLASGSITGTQYARWQTRGAGAGDPAFIGGNPLSTTFKVGAPLTKNLGPYWEVNIDTASSSDLQQYDVLLLPYHYGSTQFTPLERDALRRYVDGGGTIWLEDEGGFDIRSGAIRNEGQFVISLAFNTVFGPGVPVPASIHHPLLNFPFAIGQADIAGLVPSQGLVGSLNAITGLGGDIEEPNVLQPVVTQGGGTLIAAGDYGAGHIIVSSAAVASGINNLVGGFNVGENGNSGAVSGETMLAASPVDLEFAYNLIAWTSSIPTANVNARRLGGSQENVGSTLGTRWSTAPLSAVNNNDLGSGAVILKGVVFWVGPGATGNVLLHAFDGSPEEDLDNDGNPDDGIPDYIYGTPYDEVWNADLSGSGNNFSTPTLMSIASGDYVAVTSSTGNTLVYHAFPQSAAGVLLPSGVSAWNFKSPSNAVDLRSSLINSNNIAVPVPSPVFSDGVLFTLYQDGTADANNVWHIAALNPNNGAGMFQGALPNSVFPPTSLINGQVIPGIPNPQGSLTAGYVKATDTGAMDKVIYVTTGSRLPVTAGQNTSGTIYGAWFSSKGDPLTLVAGPSTVGNPNPPYQAEGTRNRIPWYTNPGNADPLNPIIHDVHPNGTVTRYDLTGSGSPNTFTITANPAAQGTTYQITLTPQPNANDQIYADYTLDWPDAPVGGATPDNRGMALISRAWTLPIDGGSASIVVSGGAALSPDDFLFVSGGDYTDGDRIFAVHEQYRSAATGAASRSRGTTVAWSFFPNGLSDEPANTGETLTPRFVNSDPFGYAPPGQPALPITKYAVSDFEAIGAPAYANGAVYQVGFAHFYLNGTQRVFDGTVIIALQANPNMSFTATAADGTQLALPNTPLTLEQLDLIHSTALQPVYVQLKENVNFTVDRSSSTFSIFNCQAGGQGAATFNTALPIYIRTGAINAQGGGGTDVTNGNPIVNTQTGYGVLDNVLWWMVIPYGAFAGGNPVWQTLPPFNIGGADHPASGPSVVGDSLYFGTTTGNIVTVSTTGINANGGQVPVYNTNGTLRITETPAFYNAAGVAVPHAIINPPLATAGLVVTGGMDGLLAQDNQLTIVADAHRLIEVDRGVNAVWTLDATQTYGIQPGQGPGGNQIVASKVSLSRPNVVHRSSLNTYLVADTGNNRVLQTDQSGLVSWEIHNVYNDLAFLRPGDPLSLSSPTDIESFTQTGTTNIAFTSPYTGETFTYNPGGGVWFAFHYFIADSGNYRGLEIVDIYGPNGSPIVMAGSAGHTATMFHQIVFTTLSQSEQNRSYRYRTIQQFTVWDSAANVLRTYMAAAIDNAKSAAVDVGAVPIGNNAPTTIGSPGGSLMIIKRYPATGNDGDVQTAINSIVFTNAAQTTILSRHALSSPKWFKEFYAPNAANPTQPTLQYLLADSSGCYVVQPGTTPLTASEAVVQWALTSDDYYKLTGRKLNATSITKLEQSDFDNINNVYRPRYLITNTYTGFDDIVNRFGLAPTSNVTQGQIHGEVFEIRSLDYYQNGNSYSNAPASSWLYGVNANGYLYLNTPTSQTTGSAITWIAPREVVPTAGAQQRPIQRSIGVVGQGTTSQIFEQPTFSDRPY